MRRATAVVVLGGLLSGSLLGLGVTGAGAGSPVTSVDTTQPQAPEVAVEVTPTSARPGEVFAVIMTGCVGGDVAAGLWVPFAADPVVSTGPLPSGGEPVSATLTVPAGAAPTDAQVVAICSLSAEAFAVVAVQILAATTSTTAVAAPPVGGLPAFTG